MKLATWNVNSLEVRLPRVLELLAQHEPDVLCMRKSKCEAAAFPVDELARAACGIARDHRKGSTPSDHAPLLLELEP